MAFPLTFTSPSGVVQCGTADLLWSGGKPPYSVSVVSAQNSLDTRTLASAGSSFNPHLSFSPVPIPGDTLVRFRVIDSSSPPQVGDTNILAIGESDDDSCLPPDERTHSSTSPPATKAPSATKTPDPKTSQPAPGSDTTSPPAQSPASSSEGASKSGGDTSLGSNSLSGASSSQGSSRSEPPASLGSPAQSSPLGSTPSGGTGNNNGTGARTHVSPAVFGGIAGVVIILILIIAGFYVWRKRVRRNQMLNDEDWFAVPGRHTDDQPFEQPPMTQQMYHAQPPQEYDAAAYAAQAQAFYPGDVKRPLHVMSADTDTDAAPSRAESSSAATDPVSIPTQLSAEEMARLADLVARRMRTQPSDVEEPPPQYQ